MPGPPPTSNARQACASRIRGAFNKRARLAVVLYVRLFNRPRRQYAACGAPRKRLRSTVVHLPINADRRSPSQVRRHGARRTIEATCAAMVKVGVKYPRDRRGGRKLIVDLPLLQRKVNWPRSGKSRARSQFKLLTIRSDSSSRHEKCCRQTVCALSGWPRCRR
jgi:hypothetical protein